MKNSNKIKTLVAAVALLSGSQAAQALTPWTNGAPDVKIYLSGGAAQDNAFAQSVYNYLAAAGSVDIFQDNNSSTKGAQFTSYYFTGSTNLASAGLNGKKILLEKRALGAAGFGVVPLIKNINLDHLDIFGSTAQNSGSWTNTTTTVSVNGTSTSIPTHYATIPTGASALGTWLVNRPSDGGFLGVDAQSLLQPQTQNYPDPSAISELSGTAYSPAWPTNLTSTSNNVTINNTGGLVYGVAVTADLYKVLQVAQIASGTLPTTTTLGAYGAASLPSLSRDFIATLLTGAISVWDDVIVNVPAAITVNGTAITAGAHPLPDFAAAAGVTAPTTATGSYSGKTKIAVGIRNPGAAVGAAAYATFLNYPFAPNAFAPATAVAENSSIELASAPIVKAAIGTSDTDNLLVDWNNGTNTSSHNHVAVSSAYAKYWGLAITTADRNSGSNGPNAAGTGGKNFRFVKIDGYAPDIANVQSGNYPFWAEGQVLISNTNNQTPGDSTTSNYTNKTAVINAFANGLSDITVTAEVNKALVQPFGNAGVFVTSSSIIGTADPAVRVPYDVTYPYVSLTYLTSSGNSQLGVRPQAQPSPGQSTDVTIQLK